MRNLGLPEGERTYAGLEELRDLLLDWHAPWATYRVEIEEAVDLGDRVLLLTKSFGALREARRRWRLRSATSGASGTGGLFASTPISTALKPLKPQKGT